MTSKTLVLDIEGTTSPTAFVTDELYPYSAKRFASWLTEHGNDPDTARAVSWIRELIGDPAAGTDHIVSALREWLATDQKVTPLKTIQGKIWEYGLERGDLVPRFFPDVIPAIRDWHAAGAQIYLFSSGSIAAQQAIFAHTPEGDLRPLLAGYYDTDKAGPKREVYSYRRITAMTGARPAETTFLSDVVEELDAAREAGWETLAVLREGEPHFAAGAGAHTHISSFAAIKVYPPPA